METMYGPADRPPRILLVDDSELQRHWLRKRLGSDRTEILEASDGLAGLEICLSNPPDLILLDLNLPFCDGFEVLRRLKDDRRTFSIPVIVVSGAAGTADKTRGLDLGAVDYVTKPFDVIELKARIRVALRTKRMQDMLEERAHVDGLTGLSNRLALEDRLATEWGIHQRHGGALAVWVADLDHFKAVNDTYGHPAGDEVLRRASEILRSSVRTTDMAARFGGEEFVIVAPHCGLPGAFKTAERFRERLAATPVIVEGTEIRVTTSVGVASWPENPSGSAADLLATADRALYLAKASGRNTVRRWPPGDLTGKLAPGESERVVDPPRRPEHDRVAVSRSR
jgi:two-component system, cell cycle response regulator